MKKSTFILILKILAAVSGAIVATLTAQSCSLTADFSKQKSGSTSSFVTYPSADTIVTGKQIGRASCRERVSSPV